MSIQARLIQQMIVYYEGDPKRVQHFMKVHNFAKTIGELEEVDEKIQYTLELAAIVHDIGIRISEKKYGDCSHKHQEEEGPAVARPMLEKLQVEPEIIQRVCYLIAHHHTWDHIQGMDYQILVEADFLVNAFEDGYPVAELEKPFNRIFKTTAGIAFACQMFGVTKE